MDSIEYQKKKKRKEAIRKFVLNFFIWLLIIAFVSTLGVYWGRDINVRVMKIAKIGKETYNYQPGSVFNYILIFNRERFASFLPRNIDEKTFNEILLNYSVESLINQGMLSAFAREMGLLPSKEIIRNIIEYKIKGVLTRVPDKGLIDYAFMEYANFSLAGENGDIMNSLGMVTSSELFSYYYLQSYIAEAELAIFNYTNYIAGRIAPEELKDYYIKNISKYVNEIEAEDVAVGSKELAYEVNKVAKEEGFDSAVNRYKDRIKLSNVIYSRKTGVAKRFELALKLKAGEISEKPQFENGEYHIFRVKRIQEFENLSKEIKNELLHSFILDNKAVLLKKYSQDIDKLMEDVNSQISAGKDLKNIAASLNAGYYRVKNIFPVSRFLYGEDKKPLPIDVGENPEIIDYAFTAETGKIAKIQKEGYVIFIKPISRKVDSKFSYTNINENVMKEYLSYKASAISKDWMASLKKRYQYKIYTNEVEKLISGKIED
ncbi:MAG: hypothetical protein ACP5QT_04200 [Brevinematia bacterium]